MTMGEKILNMRKARGWNQEDLAEHVGVTRQAVSRWESDSAKPDADKIIALCDLFGVSADYLLRDQYSGEGSTAQGEKPPVNALTAKARSMTMRQWVSCSMSLTGGLMMFILKLIYIFKDTNYTYFSMSGYAYTGYIGFIMTEDLHITWFLACAAFLGGLIYLFIWPMIRKKKEKSASSGETD